MTNNNIGTLYLVLGLTISIIGTLYFIIIRIELAYPWAQFVGSNLLFYNVIIKEHTFIMIFFMVIFLVYYVRLIIHIRGEDDIISSVVEVSKKGIPPTNIQSEGGFIVRFTKAGHDYLLKNEKGANSRLLGHIKILNNDKRSYEFLAQRLNFIEFNKLHPQLVYNVIKDGNNSKYYSMALTSSKKGSYVNIDDNNKVEIIDCISLTKDGGIGSNGLVKLVFETNIPNKDLDNTFLYPNDKETIETGKIATKKIGIILDKKEELFSIKFFSLNEDYINILRRISELEGWSDNEEKSKALANLIDQKKLLKNMIDLIYGREI